MTDRPSRPRAGRSSEAPPSRPARRDRGLRRRRHRRPGLLPVELRVDLRAALPGWVVARLVVGVAAVVALVAADELQPLGRPLQLDQGLFAWDAAFFRDIADVGYEDLGDEARRFFPLVPLLAWVLSYPLLGNVGVALIAVVNVAALAAGALVHRLALLETGDREMARRSAWLLAVLPPAYVLVLGYADAVLLALTVGGFLALRRRRWWAAAAVGFLAGLTRPVGAALALAAAIEGLRRSRGTGWRERIARLAATVAPLAGVATYLAWVEVRFGDGMLPLRLQTEPAMGASWSDLLTRVGAAVVDLAAGERLGEGLHAPWILLSLGLLVVVARRLPSSYTVFAAVLLVVGLAAEDLASFERHALAAFPLVLALGMVTGPRFLDRSVLVVAGAGLAGFAALALLGVFVP